MAISNEAASGARPQTLRDIRGGPPAEIDPSKTAIIIIDAQREYAEGKLKLDNIQPALTEIAKLREWARDRGIGVIHVRQYAPAGAPIFAEGSPFADFLPEAEPATGEPVIVKNNPNAFHQTTLDALLKDRGCTHLILAGFMAHMCIDSSARAAFDLDYEVFVVRSATADRPLPAASGGTMSAADVINGALTALNDRFALVVENLAELQKFELAAAAA